MTLLRLLRRHKTLLVLALVALVLRVWYLSFNPLWPQFSNADDGDYYRRALRLAVSGQYVDDNWLIRPPFHVWIFAGWLKLALVLGQSPAFGVQLIQAFQAVLGAGMVPLCYSIARRLFEPSPRARRAGLWFAGFWAVWFPFVELPATLFSEPIYLFLFAVHIWLLLRYDRRGRTADLVLGGLTLGCAALTRSPALYALVFVVPWLLLRALQRTGAGSLPARLIGAARAIAAPAALLAVCALAVVLPWTMRNWIEYRRFIPVDTLGPINLWLDLGEASDRDRKINELRALPQADRQQYATERVREILAEDPLRPLRNVWPSFRHVWKAQYIEDYWVKRSFFTRPLREAAPLGLPGDLIWLVVAVAGVAGLLHPATDRPFKLLLLLWLGYTFATVLVFHVEPRYLLPIWWLLGLYAAWSLAEGRRVVALLRGRIARATLVAAGVAGVVALTFSYRDYAAIVARGAQRELAMVRGDRAYAAGNWQAAEQSYRRALAADPGFADGAVSLALALGAQDRTAEALAELPKERTRRAELVEGMLKRRADDWDGARAALETVEARMGEDGQRWALKQAAEARSSLLLGDGGTDLGYVAGFAESELNGDRSFRWLLGDGTVVLPLATPIAEGDEVVLELAAPLELGGPLELWINGYRSGRFVPQSGWRAYRFGVPRELAGATELRIDLHAPTRLPLAEDPHSQDARALSIMLHRVAVE